MIYFIQLNMFPFCITRCSLKYWLYHSKGTNTLIRSSLVKNLSKYNTFYVTQRESAWQVYQRINCFNKKLIQIVFKNVFEKYFYILS